MCPRGCCKFVYALVLLFNSYFRVLDAPMVLRDVIYVFARYSTLYESLAGFVGNLQTSYAMQYRRTSSEYNVYVRNMRIIIPI